MTALGISLTALVFERLINPFAYLCPGHACCLTDSCQVFEGDAGGVFDVPVADGLFANSGYFTQPVCCPVGISEYLF